MTTDLMPFDYQGQQVRTVLIDDEPWFVAADATALLGYGGGARNAVARLPERMKGVAEINTPGGPQRMTIINEAGINRLIMRSDLPSAEVIQDWIAEEVLPTIRKTGSYSATPALTGAELLARAVLEAQSMLAAKDERIAELEPRAEVADRLLDADGDLSVADAAKSLTRAGIDTGATRLFKTLAGLGWIYRGQSDGRWHVYQSAITSGYMSVIPQSHYHPKTGELVMDPPQPRVTAKGLQRLMKELTPATELQPA